MHFMNNQKHSNAANKLKTQNEEMEALLTDLSNISESRCHIGPNHEDPSFVLHEPTPTGFGVSGSNNNSIDWDRKYQDALIVRKDYHKRNVALKNQYDELVISCENSKKEYEKVTKRHDVYCNRRCSCYNGTKFRD